MNQYVLADRSGTAAYEFDGGRPAPFLLRIALFGAVSVLVVVSGSQFSTQTSALLAQIAIVVLACAAFILGFLGSGWRIQMPVEALFLILYWAWALSGVLVASQFDQFIMDMTTLTKNTCLYLLILNIVRSRKDFLWMGTGYVCSVLLFFLIAGPQAFEAHRAIYGVAARASGVSGDANGTAMHGIMCSIVLGMFFAVTRNKVIKAVCLAALPVFFYMIMVSGSRSGMLGSILIAPFIYLWFIRGQLRNRGPLLKLSGLFIGIGLAVSVFIFLVNSPHWYRVQETLGLGSYTTNSVDKDMRTRMTVAGFKLALKYPVFGVGYEQYRFRASEVDLGIKQVCHSTWANAAGCLGLPGLFLGATAMILLTRRAFRLRKTPTLSEYDTAVVSLFCAFLVFWWFHSFFFIDLGEKFSFPFVIGFAGYMKALSDVHCRRAPASTAPTYGFSHTPNAYGRSFQPPAQSV